MRVASRQEPIRATGHRANATHTIAAAQRHGTSSTATLGTIRAVALPCEREIAGEGHHCDLGSIGPKRKVLYHVMHELEGLLKRRDVHTLAAINNKGNIGGDVALRCRYGHHHMNWYPQRSSSHRDEPKGSSRDCCFPQRNDLRISRAPDEGERGHSARVEERVS